MKLALGTVQFGLNYGIANNKGQPTFDEVKSIVAYAKECDINTFDTAITYGSSEQRLGEIGINDADVISKLQAIPVDEKELPNWIQREVDQSLKRLGITSLYGLLLHRPEQLDGKYGDALYKVLLALKEEGKVRKIGISIYGPEELDRIVPIYPLDIVQAPFNIFDRRLIESGWMARMSAQGMELHVRSVFLQGLLLMSKKDRSAKFDRWSGLWTDYENWLWQSDLTPLQACLLHALSFREIHKVILGVDCLSQLQQIVEFTKSSKPVQAPIHLQTSDMELLNPALWGKL